MKLSSIILRIALPSVLGIVAATMIARPAYASCECNICFTSDGNCDLTDIKIACKETTSGCEDRPCTSQDCIVS